MSTSILELNGSEIEEFRWEDGNINLVFSLAYIIRSAAGTQDTKWRQTGTLELRDAEVTGSLPNEPCVITAGRIQVNQFTYVDMLTIPLESPGAIQLELELGGQPGKVTINAEYVKLNLFGTARYVEHIA